MIRPKPTGVLRKWVVWRYDPALGRKVLVHVKVVRCPFTQVVTRVEKQVGPEPPS